MSGATLGKICRTITRLWVAPIDPTRITYCRSRSERTCERTIRAIDGQPESPITSTMIPRLWPKIAARTITSGIVGITRKKSVSRMRSASVPRPKYPATSPIPAPRTTEIAVANSPTSNEMPAPARSSLNTSLPSSSVPSQCAVDGAAKISAAVLPTAVESNGKSVGPSVAIDHERQEQDAGSPDGVEPHLTPDPDERGARTRPIVGRLHRFRDARHYASLTLGSST